MKKKCYQCEKVKEGSITDTGVFVCYSCQSEDSEYEERDHKERSKNRLRLSQQKRKLFKQVCQNND